MVTGTYIPELMLNSMGVYVGDCNEYSVYACEYIECALNMKHSSVATGGSYAYMMWMCVFCNHTTYAVRTPSPYSTAHRNAKHII